MVVAQMVSVQTLLVLTPANATQAILEMDLLALVGLLICLLNIGVKFSFLIKKPRLHAWTG